MPSFDVQQKLRNTTGGRSQRDGLSDLVVDLLPLGPVLVVIELHQLELAVEQRLDSDECGTGSESPRKPRKVGLLDQDLPHQLLLVSALHKPNLAHEPHAPPSLDESCSHCRADCHMPVTADAAAATRGRQGCSGSHRRRRLVARSA
jgi:hypothetical protein